ncbi:hypothetical protein B0J14DRAFT_695277 [Halenospora varia]|nr:hypothetical protein B0J14DRAFT_695277 [Halenospora varia]
MSPVTPNTYQSNFNTLDFPCSSFPAHTRTSQLPLPRRSQYGSVNVLLLHWQDDSLGVQKEIKDLKDMFQKSYNYNTNLIKIRSKDSHEQVHAALEALKGQSGPGDLMIVYYGGHNRPDQHLRFHFGTESRSGEDKPNTGSMEVIAASGTPGRANGPKNQPHDPPAFTDHLREELKERARRNFRNYADIDQQEYDFDDDDGKVVSWHPTPVHFMLGEGERPCTMVPINGDGGDSQLPSRPTFPYNGPPNLPTAPATPFTGISSPPPSEEQTTGMPQGPFEEPVSPSMAQQEAQFYPNTSGIKHHLHHQWSMVPLLFQLICHMLHLSTVS